MPCSCRTKVLTSARMVPEPHTDQFQRACTGLRLACGRLLNSCIPRSISTLSNSVLEGYLASVVEDADARLAQRSSRAQRLSHQQDGPLSFKLNLELELDKQQRRMLELAVAPRFQARLARVPECRNSPASGAATGLTHYCTSTGLQALAGGWRSAAKETPTTSLRGEAFAGSPSPLGRGIHHVQMPLEASERDAPFLRPAKQGSCARPCRGPCKLLRAQGPGPALECRGSQRWLGGQRARPALAAAWAGHAVSAAALPLPPTVACALLTGFSCVSCRLMLANHGDAACDRPPMPAYSPAAARPLVCLLPPAGATPAAAGRPRTECCSTTTTTTGETAWLV